MFSLTEGLLLPDRSAQLEEPAWLARAQSGDRAALEMLFRQYQRPVYSLCYRLLGRRDDAEDAAQATFVSAFRAIGQFRGRSSLKTWMYRIAVNQSRNILRHRRNVPDPLPDDAACSDRIPDVVRNAAVHAALLRMRPEQRLVLALFYWEELSCEEIATIVEISLSAAKMRLKRARAEFERQYGGEP